MPQKVYLPPEQLRKSKFYSQNENNNFDFSAEAKKLIFQIPFVSVECGHNTELILVGGGGGSFKGGVPSGLILARLNKQNNDVTIVPVSYINTEPFICQAVAIHPKYPLQLVIALDKNISICEFEEYQPNLEQMSVCEEIHRFEVDEKDALNSLAFNSTGTRLAAGGSDQKIRVYHYDFMDPPKPSETSAPTPLYTLQCTSADGIENLCFSSSSKYIAASDSTRKLYVWDTANPTQARHLQYNKCTFRGCIFHGDNLIGIGNTEHCLLVKFNVDKESVLTTVNIGKPRGKTIVKSPCGEYGAVLTLNPELVIIYELRTLKRIDTIKITGVEMPFSLAFTKDSEHIVLSGADKLVELLPINYNRSVACWKFCLLFIILLLILTVIFPEEAKNFTTCIIDSDKDEL